MRLGLAKLHDGDGEGGETAYRESIALFEKLGETDLDGVRGGFLDLLIRRKKFDEAATLAEDLMPRARQNDKPIMLIGRLRQLAKINHGRTAYDAALHNLDEALALVNEHLPKANPLTLNVWLDFSVIRHAHGDVSGAVEASTKAFAIARQLNKPGTHDWTSCLDIHLKMLQAAGRAREIPGVLTTARDDTEAAHGRDHPQFVVLDKRLSELAGAAP
jgi:hypothetical protein